MWSQGGDIMPLNRNEMKEAMQEALKEWLDSKFIQFGKWSMAALAAIVVASLTYLVLWANGWRHT